MGVKVLRFVVIGLFLFLGQCSGDNAQNEIQENKVEISPNTLNLVLGDAPLQLSARLFKAGGGTELEGPFVWSSEDPSIVSVDQDGFVIGLKIGVTRVMAQTNGIIGTARLGVMSPNPGAAAITLSGHAAYEDKIFDKTGFTGAIENRPIRNALIELVAIDGFVKIASGVTDAFGDFKLAANNATRRGGLYLRVLSTTDPADPIKLEVRNNPEDQAFLAIVSSGIDDSAADPFGANSALLAKTTDIGGGFNILDNLRAAADFVNDSGPCPAPNTACALPLLIAYWEPGSTQGTYYRTPENIIFICGGGVSEDCRSDDPDEYDDSVIIHEFGHFVLQRFSKDRSPGGTHSLTETDQDIRLSWSEGWANFFSSAVRNSPLYVDTSGGHVLLSFNLEDYSTYPNSTLETLVRYTTSEIAVSGVLWDTFDPIEVALDNDAISLGFKDVFQIVTQFPAVSSTYTMESFWLSFQALQGQKLSGFRTVAKGRDMHFEEDSFEGKEKGLEVNDASNQVHTLFQNNLPLDEDAIPFEVDKGLSYTVRTSNLKNGADTMLSIKEKNGSLVIENDNLDHRIYTNCSNNFFTGLSDCPRNGPHTLSSSVSFLWNGEDGTTLYAHVKPSPAAPPSAGLFGTYEINLSRP